MEHPHVIIRDIQRGLSAAISQTGSLSAFHRYMQDHSRFHEHRADWDDLCSYTLRKLYKWDPDSGEDFNALTLYGMHMMVEDFLSREEWLRPEELRGDFS